jgi:hypothetical protein
MAYIRKRDPRDRIVDNGDGTATVILTRGFTSIIDACEIEHVVKHCWAIDTRPKTKLYAKCMKSLYLHRYILRDIPNGMVVDHISGDSLDNRRSNLRIVTVAQNNKNQRGYGASGFKGVFRGGVKSWNAVICSEGVVYQLGLFADPISAAIAYNEAAIRLHGEFAALNVIPCNMEVA